jgi:hypothetical protein
LERDSSLEDDLAALRARVQVRKHARLPEGKQDPDAADL